MSTQLARARLGAKESDLQGLGGGERVKLVDQATNEQHQQGEARALREVVVHRVLVRAGHQLHQQVDGADDRANGNLEDAARRERNEEADEQELAQHLDQLPPKGCGLRVGVTWRVRMRVRVRVRMRVRT